MPPKQLNYDLNNLGPQKIYIEYPIWFRFSEEKLINLLGKYKKNLETRRFWLIPLSILIPLIFTVLTSNFKDTIFLKADYIKVSCYIAILLIIAWFLISVIRSFKSKSIDKIMFDLKNELKEWDIDKKDMRFCGLRKLKKHELEYAFKNIIIDAVHQTYFGEYLGLYRDISNEIIFEVTGREKIKYIIVAHYLSPNKGIYFPSNQLKNHFIKAENLGSPYIIVTNALELTQNAIEALNEFNKKHEKTKLFFIRGTHQTQFINKFKEIIK